MQQLIEPTSGRPETSAMPSPTSSTRPICSAAAVTDFRLGQRANGAQAHDGADPCFRRVRQSPNSLRQTIDKPGDACCFGETSQHLRGDIDGEQAGTILGFNRFISSETFGIVVCRAAQPIGFLARGGQDRGLFGIGLSRDGFQRLGTVVCERCVGVGGFVSF
jgi:hypothetical protein